MMQLTTYALLFSLLSCFLDVMIIALLLGFMRQTKMNESVELALKMMAVLFVAIVLVSVDQVDGQEDIPPAEADVLSESGEPIIFHPGLMQQAASAITRDVLGEEAAVQAGHLLFLEGNYSAGNWSLNNSTVVA